MIVKHFQMVQTQIDQLIKVQKDLLILMPLKKNMLMKLELEVELLPRILYILRGIPKELSRILNKLKIVVPLVRKGKRNIKLLYNPLNLL